MKPRSKTFIAILLLALCAMSARSEGRTQPKAKEPATAPKHTGAEPLYIIFQLGTGQSDFEKQLPEIKSEFGSSHVDSSRYIGFGVALMTLKTPPEELRREVTHAVDLAEQNDMPVLLKLDDMNFSEERTDPSEVEWTAFPKPGESHGPLAKHYWLNWGSWMALPPPPNFESRAFLEDVARRLKDGVLPPLGFPNTGRCSGLCSCRGMNSARSP
jgi:hypothetical protein